MAMSLLRLTDISIIYYLKDLLYKKGFLADKYNVLDSYPSDTAKVNIFPTISVEANISRDKPLELGHSGLLEVVFILDVFAKGDGQADDVAYIIWEALKLEYPSVYDFNIAYPLDTLPVDYSGISTIASMSFSSPRIINVSAPAYTEIIAEKFHRMVTFNCVVIK